MIRLTIFDSDGTLIDSRLDLCLAVNHALRTVRLPERSLDEVSGFVGEGAARLIERAVAPRLDLRDAALAAWWEHYQAHLLDHTVLFPGMAELIASATVPLAVHTNKPGRLARHPGGPAVASASRRSSAGMRRRASPIRRGTRRILEQLGVAAAGGAVGDSLVDLATARAVPIRFIPVAWGLVTPDALAGRRRSSCRAHGG